MSGELDDVRQRMDAQDLLLQALHVTQSNHTQRLTRIEERLDRIDGALRSVDTALRSVGTALGRI
jgi:hypothetical protein